MMIPNMDEKLAALRDRKRNNTIEKLRVAIDHALFLEMDQRSKWHAAADILSEKEAEELMAAILRENMRWKKGIRKLKLNREIHTANV